MDLKEKIKSLPLSPGVYLMKDSLGGIIYVGKSKSLKKRVQSYFQASKNHSPKVEKLVKNLKDFDYIVTDTEFEALILECKLIKKLKPRYNRLMKNPLSYTYMGIQSDKSCPDIKIIDNPNESNCSLHFGPFTSKNTVEKAIEGIKGFYKINCSNSNKRNIPCLNHSLGKCIGMCLGGSAAQEYHSIINKIATLLNGPDKSILREMEEKMLYLSKNFDFENAAKYRDYIDAINYVISNEVIIKFIENNRNIVMVEHLNNYTIKLFLINRNEVLFNEKYDLESTDIEQLHRSIKSNILNYFYAGKLDSYTIINKHEFDEAQIIHNYLKNSSCNYAIFPEECTRLKDENYINETINKLISSRKKQT